MELKLRKFLDLKHSQTLTEVHSHQGGFNTNASLESVEVSLDHASSEIESRQIVSYSLGLKESLREVLGSLRKQREKLNRTPYILDRESETLTLR